MFKLGVASAEITAFTATPEYFDVGDSLDISLTLTNTGTTDISGTALIKIYDEAGGIVEVFTHDFAGLVPAGSLIFDDAWDTSGAAEGSYRIEANVSYDSKATGLVSVTVNAEEPGGGGLSR